MSASSVKIPKVFYQIISFLLFFIGVANIITKKASGNYKGAIYSQEGITAIMIGGLFVLASFLILGGYIQDYYRLCHRINNMDLFSKLCIAWALQYISITLMVYLFSIRATWIALLMFLLLLIVVVSSRFLVKKSIS